MRIKWTEEEVKFLKSHYYTKGSHWCADKLNRSFSSVSKKATALSLKGDKGKHLRKNITGKTFGKLTAIYDTGKSHKIYGRLWKFECECGEFIILPLRRIFNKSNPTTSCGCQKRLRGQNSPHWRGCGDLSKRFYTSIVSSAKNRNIKFELSIEYLWQLYIEQGKMCALTGLPLTMIASSADISDNKSDHTASLDRIDSSIHYVKNNVQWVHKDINRIKWELSEDKFKEYCELVVQHDKISPRIWVDGIDDSSFDIEI